MSGPYAQAAGDYWSAGWRGILPLPPRRKKEPPTGFTGWSGAYPSYPDVMAWIEDRGEGNIALHLPDGVLGIDVDQYDGKTGGATLARYEAMYGELPATWLTTSRENVSGIRLFRVPVAENGVSLAWPSELKPDIQLVHRGHRYMVVPPSIHPETGRAYRWVTPDGVTSTVAPRVSELPELPWAWVVGLTEGREAHTYTGADMTEAEIRRWLEDHNHGQSCNPMDEAVDGALSELSTGGHDSLRMLMHIVGTAAAGHAGLYAGLSEVRQAFLAEVSPRRDQGEREAATEWTRSLFGAVDKIVGEMAKTGTASSQVDPCELFELVSPTATPAPAIESWESPSGGAEEGSEESVDDDSLDNEAEDAPRVLTPDERREMAVQREVGQLAIREEARRRLETENAPELTVLGFGDFLNSPEPEPVVPQLFYVDSLARIFGAPGCGKSFLALDLAFHVALGRDWRGQPVRQGPVVYVMAEGQRVNTHRAKAWLDRHGVGPDELEGKFYAVPDKVLLTEVAARPFVQAITDLQPVLIILDTQNAMQVGEENSASDTRVMRDAMMAMTKATQACVALIGHTGKSNAEAARGSNAAEGAMDTEILVKNDGEHPPRVTVEVTRDKAAEDGATWDFFLRMHPVPDSDKPGAVLVAPDEDFVPIERVRRDEPAWKTVEGVAVPTELVHYEGPGEQVMPLLAKFMAHEASPRHGDPHGVGLTRAEAQKAMKLEGFEETSVRRSWSVLIARGFIDRAEGCKSDTGKHVWTV